MANWWTRMPCRLRNDARLAKCDLAAGWVYLCHHTMEADESLDCGPTEKWLAAQCNATPKEYRKLKAQLVAAGLLTEAGRVIGYAEMQVKDPANSERQARHREKARVRVTENAPRAVTSNVTSNGAREEKRREIEEEEGDSSSSVHEPTRARGRRADPEPPPVVASDHPEPERSQIATRKQQQFAARLLKQAGLTVASWLEGHGYDELLDVHVDEIKARYKSGRAPAVTGPRGYEVQEQPDPDLTPEDRLRSAEALRATRRQLCGQGAASR